LYKDGFPLNSTTPHPNINNKSRSSTIISPTIFHIYVNDLPGYLRKNGNTKCCLFADDLVIWKMAKNKSTQQQKLTEIMNNALKTLEKLAAENNMNINTQKTNYQFFSMQHNDYNFNLKINQDNLEKMKTPNI
jgi:hypothetical protein